MVVVAAVVVVSKDDDACRSGEPDAVPSLIQDGDNEDTICGCKMGKNDCADVISSAVRRGCFVVVVVDDDDDDDDV